MELNETITTLEVTAKSKKKSQEKKWNKKISDYNNYLEEYLKHYKKAIKGNAVSLSTYPYFKLKFEYSNIKLNMAIKEGLLTKKQQAAIFKIQSKIVNMCIK